MSTDEPHMSTNESTHVHKWATTCPSMSHTCPLMSLRMFTNEPPNDHQLAIKCSPMSHKCPPMSHYMSTNESHHISVCFYISTSKPLHVHQWEPPHLWEHVYQWASTSQSTKTCLVSHLYFYKMRQGWEFAHSLIAHSLIAHTLIPSFRSNQMSDCERFA